MLVELSGVRPVRRLALLCLISVAGAGPASGQVTVVPRQVSVGTRVRVLAPDLRSDLYVGRVDSLDSRVMVLDTAGSRTRLGLELGPVLVDDFRRVTITLSTIESIEVSGGRTARGATVRGIVFGALIGGLVIGLGNLPQVNPSTSDFLRSAPIGLAAGALVGGVIGFKLGGESWLPAVIPRPPSRPSGAPRATGLRSPT